MELRPQALDDVGLRGAVQQLVETWSARTMIPAEFFCRGLDEQQLRPEVTTGVYRIIQEALNNIARHAVASKVGVVMEVAEGMLVTVIEDDGQGFSVLDEMERKRERGGLGLLGMKERATLARGRLEIESAKEQGTSILVRIPLGPSDDE